MSDWDIIPVNLQVEITHNNEYITQSLSEGIHIIDCLNLNTKRFKVKNEWHYMEMYSFKLKEVLDDKTCYNCAHFDCEHCVNNADTPNKFGWCRAYEQHPKIVKNTSCCLNFKRSYVVRELCPDIDKPIDNRFELLDI